MEVESAEGTLGQGLRLSAAHSSASGSEQMAALADTAKVWQAAKAEGSSLLTEGQQSSSSLAGSSASAPVSELKSEGAANKAARKSPAPRSSEFNPLKLPFYETVAKQLLDDGCVLCRPCSDTPCQPWTSLTTICF